LYLPSVFFSQILPISDIRIYGRILVISGIRIDGLQFERVQFLTKNVTLVLLYKEINNQEKMHSSFHIWNIKLGHVYC